MLRTLFAALFVVSALAKDPETTGPGTRRLKSTETSGGTVGGTRRLAFDEELLNAARLVKLEEETARRLASCDTNPGEGADGTPCDPTRRLANDGGNPDPNIDNRRLAGTGGSPDPNKP